MNEFLELIRSHLIQTIWKTLRHGKVSSERRREQEAPFETLIIRQKFVFIAKDTYITLSKSLMQNMDNR